MFNKKISEDITNQEKNILNLTEQIRDHTSENREKLQHNKAQINAQIGEIKSLH